MNTHAQKIKAFETEQVVMKAKPDRQKERGTEQNKKNEKKATKGELPC